MKTQCRQSSERYGLLWFALYFAVLAALFASAVNGQAAGLLIADGGLGGVLEIKEQTVNVTINNGVAVTEVNQIFKNTENRQVEALYTFPIPKAASVSNFSMWINGKEMVGEVVEKQRAREIYNSYKAVRRDPGLLEQNDYKNFEMRIFPIGPGAEQRVQIAYYQELDMDHDWATYVYPLATVSRQDLANSKTTGKFAFTIDVKSEVPIVELSSPSHAKDFVVTKHSEQYQQASLESQSWDLNRDLVLSYHVARPRTGLDLLTSRQGNEDGYLCLTLTAGEELAVQNAGADYVFVLDVSGSMANDSKLVMSRNSVDAFIKTLSPQDRFEVLAFNTTPMPLFKQLSPVNPQALTEAVNFLNGQSARGSTTLRPAVETAYKYAAPDRPLNVVILSDGMTEEQERAQLLQLIGARPSGVRVFSICVGNEVNKPLMSKLAADAGGIASFISQEDDFARQAQAFQRKLMHPAAQNLKIEFQGGDVYDVEPKKLPNLFHGSPVRLYARYRQAGPARVVVSGDVNGKPFQTTTELTLPLADEANPEIERMWAWHRMQRLLGEADAKGSRDGVTQEIVRLGEGYSIVTEYTSFLVLENDAEYQRWKIERKNSTRLERDRKKQEVLRAEFGKLREKTLSSIGPAPATGKAPANKSTEPEVIYEAVPDEQPANAPANNQNVAQAPPSQTSPSAGNPRPSSGRNVDISLGGGALDPITACIALSGAATLLASRRKKRRADC